MEMELTRTFNSPRELVWRAWTEADNLQQWWGPQHFTNPRCEIDLRPGGRIHIDMRAPDGTVYPMGGTVDGVVGDHVLLAPPFITTSEQVEAICARLTDAIAGALALISASVIH